eukprot:573389-Lingulodinium_polyedra.AAC.1
MRLARRIFREKAFQPRLEFEAIRASGTVCPRLELRLAAHYAGPRRVQRRPSRALRATATS